MRVREATLAIAVALAWVAPAAAGDADDTVLLANGGRIRGTVVEEDPVKGVRIKLADGTMKTIAAKDVKSVVYGGQAPAPSRAPAPPPSAPPAPAPSSSATSTPQSAAEGTKDEEEPRKKKKEKKNADADDEEPAQAPSEAPRIAFSGGVRTGFALAFSAQDGFRKSDGITGMVPIWIDAGVSTKNLFAGAYAQYGFVLLPEGHACSSGYTTCPWSLSDIRAGLEAHYHFAASEDAKTDPWAGAGVGYELQRLHEEQSGGSSPAVTIDSTLHGFEFFNLQLGLDYRAQRSFAVGPFFTATISRLGSYGITQAQSGATMSTSGDTPTPAPIPVWLLLGVRATLGGSP